MPVAVWKHWRRKLAVSSISKPEWRWRREGFGTAYEVVEFGSSVVGAMLRVMA